MPENCRKVNSMWYSEVNLVVVMLVVVELVELVVLVAVVVEAVVNHVGDS